MHINILAIGDVVGNPGLQMLTRHLRHIKKLYHIGFTVVNGENAADVGITPGQADMIFDAGADVITLGNHTYHKRDICDYLDECPYILRPANYSPQKPGRGFGVFETSFGRIAVLSLIGRCSMDDFNPDNPFTKAEQIISSLETPLAVVDIHAEATSEKLAMGYFLDGRVSAVFGTHTHVPTADEQVLPNGTGYITDLGMTGPYHSVLGITPSQSVDLFVGNMPSRFKPAPGPCKLDGAIFTVDSESGLCIKAERVNICD